MKKVFIFWIILTLLAIFVSSTVFSQDPTKIYNSKAPDKSLLDSIWSFSPFSGSISTGICLPLGKLAEYYYPCPQIGFGIGFKISPIIRFDLGLTPRFLIEKKKPEFIINNTVVGAKVLTSMSIGGWSTYRIFRNKYLFTELVSGFHYEPLDIDNPHPISSKDSVLHISTWGISLGMNTWINKCRNHNIGVRLLYNYAPYNRDKMLVSNIGGHFTSISICYKFPKRDVTYKKTYDDYYEEHFIQQPLILQRKSKLNKIKKLHLDRVYNFKTVDTIYYSKILSFNNTTLTITRWIEGTKIDTTYYRNFRGKIGTDTTIISRRYIIDTIAVPNSDILYIKRDWFKSRKWLEPFGWISIGAVLGVGLLPIVAIDKGNEGVNEWLRFESILIAISLPPIIIGTRTRKFDLQKKWEIKTK